MKALAILLLALPLIFISCQDQYTKARPVIMIAESKEGGLVLQDNRGRIYTLPFWKHEAQAYSATFQPGDTILYP